VSKSATKYIAKIQNPTTLGGVHIVAEQDAADGCVASVAAGVGHVRITREQLVSLRDQIDRWLENHK
jgi:hypothetical protein